MNVRLDVAVPLDEAAKIKARLDMMRDTLQKSITATEKKISAGNPKAITERKDLIEKLNKVTYSNVTRVVTMLGVKALEKVGNDDLLTQVVSTGLVRGRRKRAA